MADYSDWDTASDENDAIVRKEGDAASGSEIDDTGSLSTDKGPAGFIMPSSTADAGRKPGSKRGVLHNFDDSDESEDLPGQGAPAPPEDDDEFDDDELSSGRGATGSRPLAAAMASSALGTRPTARPAGKAVKALLTNPESDSDYDTDEQIKRREARKKHQSGAMQGLESMLQQHMAKKVEIDAEQELEQQQQQQQPPEFPPPVPDPPALESPPPVPQMPPANLSDDSDFDSDIGDDGPLTDLDEGSSVAPAPQPDETPPSPPGPLFGAAARKTDEADDRSVSPPLGISYRGNRENPFPTLTPETTPLPAPSEMKGGVRGILNRRAAEAEDDEGSLEDSMELVNKRVQGRGVARGGPDRDASPSPPLGIRRGGDQISHADPASAVPQPIQTGAQDKRPPPPAKRVTTHFNPAVLSRIEPHPPLELSPEPCTPAVFVRAEEFDKISPAQLYVTPWSSRELTMFPAHTQQRSIELMQRGEEAIILYKCYNSTLGKFLLKKSEESDDDFHLRWCTFNTILPGLSSHGEPDLDSNLSIYSHGECIIDVTDDHCNSFNFSIGGYGTHGLTGYETWGSIPADLAFVLREDGLLAARPAVEGRFFMHDYNPLCSTYPPRGGPSLLLSVQDIFADLLAKEKKMRSSNEETMEEFRWRPPHVVRMSDSGLEQIFEHVMRTTSAAQAGGLLRSELGAFINHFFGSDLFATMMKSYAAREGEMEENEDREIFFSMCRMASQFTQSHVVHDAVWAMLTPNDETIARVDLLLQLIDAVVVAQDLHAVQAFLLEVLFQRKQTISITDAVVALENIMSPEDAADSLENTVVASLFADGRSITRQHARFAMEFSEDAVAGVPIFFQMAGDVAKAWDWEREM